jgi:hypothetical protein
MVEKNKDVFINDHLELVHLSELPFLVVHNHCKERVREREK